MNFAYCIDVNFNIQCAVSIYSLLEKVNTNISIHILHSKPSTFHKYMQSLKNHKNCKELTLHNLETEKYNFPNLENSHVSSATYFRLFLEKYLYDKGEVIYLDADTIVLDNPIELIKEEITNMRSSGFYFGASLETTKKLTPDIFERLGLSGSTYFNAGVMIFDFTNPKLKKSSKKLLLLTKNLGKKIKQWDQDVLNKFFDENYYQIDENLNFKLYEQGNLPNQDAKILHYLGSTKPWTFEGLQINNSKYYQKNYQEFFNESFFHVNSKWRKKTYFDLFVYVLSLKIFRKKNGTKILLSTLKVKKN